MYFSRSIMASALMGFAAATDHLAASESLLASATASAVGSLSTASPSSEAAAPGAMVATHVVGVGGPNGTFVFTPNNIVAQAGDLVQFQFYAKNHSVVRSTFDQPCAPLQGNATDAFFSGFMPTNATVGATSNVLTYTIRVKDTKPMWFYCSQGRHCQAGMVGVINPPPSGNRTIDSFKALAAQASENLSPGQAAGSGVQNTPNGPSGTSPGAGGNTPPSPSGSSPAQQSANAAPALGSQSFFGLGAAAVAAFAML